MIYYNILMFLRELFSDSARENAFKPVEKGESGREKKDRAKQ